MFSCHAYCITGERCDVFSNDCPVCPIRRGHHGYDFTLVNSLFGCGNIAKRVCDISFLTKKVVFVTLTIAYSLVNNFLKVLSLALAGGWCDHHPWVFYARRTTSGTVLKFYIAYGAFFAQLLVKKWPGHVRSRSYDVTRGTRSGHFCKK